MKFFFIYKSLAHPELVGNYVQPITLDERLAHARQAEKQLGATIPWLVDAMDNRLKHALSDRPNSEFVIDPNGKVVRKRAWSYPAQLRKDLEELVGKTQTVTSEESIKLNLQMPLKSAAAQGVVPRLKRPRLQALVMEPVIEKNGQPFFAKLRAEGDGPLINQGKGKLYIGFHLDPFHQAHWNNLTEPLKFRLELPEGAKFEKSQGVAVKTTAASDSDPREFLLNVGEWPDETPIKLTVVYSACVGETACHTVKQSYVLHRERDIDGGGARSAGAGFWDPKEFASQAMAGDKNGDGKLSRAEVRGLILPFFDRFDANKDGFLQESEIEEVAVWLNTHHAPGVPEGKK